MSLNIIVLAKQVPDTRNVGKDAMKEDGTINRAALPAIFNPEDLNALEQALRLKDANPGSTVTMLTMGLPRASEIIREAIYRGADRGVVLTDRALGGADTLATSYSLAQAVKKMTAIDKMTKDGTFDNLSKREKLQITRQRAKLEKNLGSIADLNRLPSALFVVDVCKEHIAVAEANRLGIPVFAIVDTNSDPSNVDFVIPANDDASKSIDLILSTVCESISEGLEERKVEKADEKASAENSDAAPRRERRRVSRKGEGEAEVAETEVAEVAEAAE